MKKIACLLLSLSYLSGCSLIHIHKMDVEQGNIITPQMTSQLHLGMSEAQVKNILGTPLLMNTFTPAQMNYVYTFKPGYGALQEKHLTLIFRAGRLERIES